VKASLQIVVRPLEKLFAIRFVQKFDAQFSCRHQRDLLLSFFIYFTCDHVEEAEQEAQAEEEVKARSRGKRRSRSRNKGKSGSKI